MVHHSATFIQLFYQLWDCNFWAIFFIIHAFPTMEFFIGLLLFFVCLFRVVVVVVLMYDVQYIYLSTELMVKVVGLVDHLSFLPFPPKYRVIKRENGL